MRHFETQCVKGYPAYNRLPSMKILYHTKVFCILPSMQQVTSMQQVRNSNSFLLVSAQYVKVYNFTCNHQLTISFYFYRFNLIFLSLIFYFFSPIIFFSGIPFLPVSATSTLRGQVRCSTSDGRIMLLFTLFFWF